MTELDVIVRVVAWIQLVSGLTFLLAARQMRGRAGHEMLGPLGLMFLLAGPARLVRGLLNDGVIIAIQLVGLAIAIVWFVRGFRTSRARVRALRNQRAQTGS